MIEKTLLLALIAAVLAGALYFAIRQRRSNATYVLGQQMADARSNEQARLKLGGTRPSPLPAGQYEQKPGVWGLLNPLPSDLDAKFRESSEAFSVLSEAERAQFTSGISLDEFYSLITFARRAAVFALRDEDAKLLQDGLTALAMIEAKRTDFRDILDALALLHYTSSRIGLNPEIVLRDAAKIAEPEVAELMIGFLRQDEKSRNLRDSWGYLEVETAFGRGFARWGFKAFAPTTDLLGTAMRIASVIDRDSYQTHSIELATDLPEVWLETDESKLLHETVPKARAGATVSARLQVNQHADANSQQFTVFIVEMDSQQSADFLLRRSQSKKQKDFCMLGVARDRIFCLVIARSFVQGVASFETGESLNRFQERIHDAICETKG